MKGDDLILLLECAHSVQVYLEQPTLEIGRRMKRRQAMVTPAQSATAVRPVGGSGAPDRFVLEAGYTPGNPVFSIAVTARVIRTQAPRGTYHVRVRAASSCGTSAPTAEATLVVP